jgi:hypothetical protein
MSNYQSVAFKRQGLLDNKQRSTLLHYVVITTVRSHTTLSIAPALSVLKRRIAAPIFHPLIGTIADEHGDLGRSTKSSHPFSKLKVEA